MLSLEDQMADEPESHTIRLLQEMRAQLTGVQGAISDLRDEMRGGFAEVKLRIGGVTHILTLLAGVSHDHEERITRLETTDR
jgi:hypothetical protein